MFYVKSCQTCGRNKMFKINDDVTRKKIDKRGSNVFYVSECGLCDEYQDIKIRNNSVDNPFEHSNKPEKKTEYDMSRVRLPYVD